MLFLIPALVLIFAAARLYARFVPAHMQVRLGLALIPAVILVFIASLACSRFVSPRVQVQQPAADSLADGRRHQIAVLSTCFHCLWAGNLQADNGAELQQTDRSHIAVLLRTPVTPTTLRIMISGPRTHLSFTTKTHLDPADTFADGTPDFLRLHTAEDRTAFRRWFTTLAERAADMPDTQLARDLPEITDCASLLRYAYRESLRVHDDRWYAQFPSESMPALNSVEQWTYPNTPLRTGLFRVQPRPFAAADLDSNAFAQFADAKTLYTRNAYRISRDISAARAGDLIFYRLLESDSQYHSMIFTGTKAEWVVYHTGPIDKHRGVMRRVLLADLLHHPDPRWRPTRENPNFLGVYRWNILREE